MNWRQARGSPAVVLPEVGDGLEVRRQALREPHHLDVALRLTLQTAARGDLVDVAIDVNLQHHRRVIGRAPGRLRHNPREPQRAQVQLIDEHVDHPKPDSPPTHNHPGIQEAEHPDGGPHLDEATTHNLRSS